MNDLSEKELEEINKALKVLFEKRIIQNITIDWSSRYIPETMNITHVSIKFQLNNKLKK